MGKISVIIPVYKAEKYLRACMDSVLGQIYTNLEIILVDDGSPDSSGAICDAYARKDARVKVIHQQNRGASEARNVAVAACTGNYVAFVDSDDIVNPHYLEYLKRALDEHCADIAYCGFRRFKAGEPEDTEVGSYEAQEIMAYSRHDALGNLFSIWFQPNLCNKLIKAELMKQVRIPNILRAEDLAACNQLLTMANTVVGLKRCPLYNYRETPGSVCSRYSEQAVSADMESRLNVFLSTYLGRYETTAVKFAYQTRRMFLDFALQIRTSSDKAYTATLKKYSKVMCKQMWFPMAKNFGDKLDYGVLYCSVRAWVWLQLIKYKVFKVPLYHQ